MRRLFGYSFATWRFHLRGKSIRGAHDIGWINDLTAGRLMRRDPRSVRGGRWSLPPSAPPVPLGAATQVGAAGRRNGRYAGIVAVAEAHARDLDEKAGEMRLDSLLRYRDVLLLPSQNIKEAAELFEQAEADALAVVDDLQGRSVLGLLNEQHALRRYAEELELRRRELAGET